MKIFPLLLSIVALSLLPAGALAQKVQVKSFEKIPDTARTYHWLTGRTLTSKGVDDNPSIDPFVRKAVEREMNLRGFTESTGKDGYEVSYLGGVGADARIDDPTIGDVMMWNIGGAPATQGRAYKKSTLVLGLKDPSTQKAVWAAMATDNFGQPSDVEQRIDKAVTKCFAKFPVAKK